MMSILHEKIKQTSFFQCNVIIKWIYIYTFFFLISIHKTYWQIV